MILHTARYSSGSPLITTDTQAGSTGRSRSVSYTHLDVYKRQAVLLSGRSKSGLRHTLMAQTFCLCTDHLDYIVVEIGKGVKVFVLTRRFFSVLLLLPCQESSNGIYS